jgi:tetratricopeptide (TPR) repeat protein
MKISHWAISAFSLVLPLTAFSQAGIYDNPQNLKVLPEDTSSELLSKTMRSFALDTGFRCSSCHVGEENQRLTEYDFASDEKELKSTARLMMKMVNSINSSHLAELGEDRVEVRCLTCHRGVNKPALTGDVLTVAAEEGGIEAMTSRYLELREQYYGSHSYDFTDMTLSDFARTRAAAGHLDQATAMLDLVLEDNPESFMAQFSYGELYHRAGNAELAIEHYRKAIEINPGSAGFLQQRIDQLQGKGEEPES